MITFSNSSFVWYVPAGCLGDDEVVREIERIDSQHRGARLAAVLVDHYDGEDVAGSGVVTSSVTPERVVTAIGGGPVSGTNFLQLLVHLAPNRLDHVPSGVILFSSRL